MSTQLKSIMFVDDDPDILSLAEISMQMAGIDFRGCTEGTQALEQLQQRLPQLLILDVMMPHMDGPETLNQIRKIYTKAQLPVLFLTAKARESSVKHLQEMTGETVLTKPFSPLTIASKLEQIWSQRQVNDQADTEKE